MICFNDCGREGTIKIGNLEVWACTECYQGDYETAKQYTSKKEQEYLKKKPKTKK